MCCVCTCFRPTTTCTCTFIFICMCVCICMHTCIYTYASMRTRRRVYKLMCTHSCVHAHVCVCACVTAHGQSCARTSAVFGFCVAPMFPQVLLKSLRRSSQYDTRPHILYNANHRCVNASRRPSARRPCFFWFLWLVQKKYVTFTLRPALPERFTPSFFLRDDSEPERPSVVRHVCVCAVCAVRVVHAHPQTHTNWAMVFRRRIIMVLGQALANI